MQIRNVRHKALRRFVETGNGAGLPAALVEKIRTIVTFLEAVAEEDEIRALPVWKPHQLTGDRAGTWALHVTKNWRITLVIDNGEIRDLDFEDYH